MPPARPHAQASASRSAILALLMVLSVFSSVPIASADPVTGTIVTFADGSLSVEVTTDTQAPSSANLSILRNTTIDSANFHLIYDSADASPGSLTLDVDSDGQYEWHLGGNGDGRVGEQIEFDNGASTTSIYANGNQTWLSTGGWRLPTAAMMASSEITVGLTPNLGAQFSGIGTVSDLKVGDMDGDGLDDAIYLVTDHIQMGGNGTPWPHIGWLKWSGTSIVTSWIPTCFDADELILGDSDNDSRTDILAIASDENTLCPHFSGNSWTQSMNLTMNEKFQDALLADLDGDGQDDLVSIDADGTLGMRSFSGGAYMSAVTTTVNSGNQVPGLENFVHVDIGSFYGNNQTIVVGETDVMTAFNTFWNFSNTNWLATMQEFECTSGPFEIFDWNGDGFEDFLGPSAAAACTATWNGTAWATTTSNLVGLSNYSVGDHDGDGTVNVFRALEGTPDGSDGTQTGSVDMHVFESDGGVNSTSISFTPHTSPRDIVFADLDGDGLDEQIVAAGEATPGLFIGAWHTLDWDLEGDGTNEMEMSGYASSTNPLSQTDQGLLITSISAELPNAAATFDYYDTRWSMMDPVARSMGGGTITQSALNMSYTATFVIETNPSSHNLSNVLNDLMVLGTGNLEVPMDVLCTRNGTVTLDALQIDWTEGASNIPVPPAPVLSLFDFNYSQVSLLWTNTTSLSDFMYYQLFRAPTGSQFSITQPLIETPLNFHIDTDGVTNQQWHYAVRSVHNLGITSNLSNFITVNVPDVPPVYDTTPPDAAIVSLADQPNDSGGVLNLSFTPSPSIDLAYTLFFVENSEFTNATGLIPIANISKVDPTTSLLASGLTDGEDYWAAAVTVDGDDNAWWNVTATGPVQSVNDTVRQSTLTLDVTGNGVYDDATHSGVLLHAGSPFSVSMQLSSEGYPLSNESVDLSVFFEMDGATWNTILTTDITGSATKSWADWTSFVDEWEAHGGMGQVSVSWDGGSFGASGQSIAGLSNSSDIVVTVDAALSSNTPSLQLDGQGMGIAHASAITTASAEQAVLDGIPIAWQLGNGTEVFGESGMAQFDSTGVTSIPVHFSTGGWLDLTPTTPWWLSISPATLRIDLYPPPPVGCTDSTANNFDEIAQFDDGSCTYDTPPLVFVNITCDEAWEIVDNSTQAMADLESNSLHCALTNNNNITIFANIAFSYSQSTPLFVDNLPSSEVNIAANESLSFIVSPSPWAIGPAPPNGTVRVDIDMTATGWIGVSDYRILAYGFIHVNDTIDEPINGGEDPQGEAGDAEEEDNLLMLIAIVGVVLAILGFVGLRMAMRDEEDEDAEVIEDEEWLPEPKKQIRTQPNMDDMPTGRSLDELTMKSSTVSMTKSKRVDHRAGQRPAPISEVLEEEYPQPEEWDYTQDEDYHIDDDGVEWWKDEVGQWWYKYPDDEDWEAFNE